MDVMDRYRLAQGYLDDGAPLAALEAAHSVEEDLADSAAGLAARCHARGWSG